MRHRAPLDRKRLPAGEGLGNGPARPCEDARERRPGNPDLLCGGTVIHPLEVDEPDGLIAVESQRDFLELARRHSGGFEEAGARWADDEAPLFRSGHGGYPEACW
jgi:hypothetical protein